MALVIKDRVRETSSTTGTGTVTVGAAYDGYRSFSSCIPTGSVVYYCIHNTSTGFESEWEVGYGTYTVAGTTLSRATVYSSSNAGALVAFSAGTKEVFITQPADQAVYQETNGDLRLISGVIEVSLDGTSGATLANATFQAFATVNGFIQTNIQNLSSGADASGDFVATRDGGTDAAFYVDMGVNSSNFTSATYPIYTPSSTYLYGLGDGTTAVDLFVGTGALGDVVVHAGGFAASNVAVTVKGTNRNILIGSTTDTGEKVQITGSAKVTGATAFGSTVALNADPTTALQAATKQYVDAAVSAGIHIHSPVRLEQEANLTATYNNGTAGVGATLTNSGTQVALTVDGVATAVNDRILVLAQTTATQNGVYVVTTVGSGATNWVLTRSSDTNTYAADTTTALDDGSYFYVSEGMTGAGESYVCTTTGTITFGTTNIVFTQFNASPTYVGGTNISISGQTISVTGAVGATNGGTGASTVTTGDLLYGSGTNAWGKLPKGAAYKTLVMDASATNVEWNAVALNQSAAVSGALGATNGGTGQSTYTLGDTLYSSATDTVAKLTGNVTTTKKYISQTGTGTASAAPAWAQVAAADISGLAASATTNTVDAGNISAGTLPAARLTGDYTGITGLGTVTTGTWSAGTIAANKGGTGITGYTIGDVIYANTASTLAALSDIASGNALLSGGVATAPAWGKIGLTTHITGTLSASNGGTGVTSATGSGSVVLSISPTLVTPVLGTPASGTLTNCTFPTLNQNTTGSAASLSATLAIGSGGTGTTTANGAFNAFAPAQGAASGKFLTTDGVNTSWGVVTPANDGTLTLNVSGTGLSGSQTFTANQGTAATFTVASNATSANTGSTIVARDASGNFTAGTVTAALTGNATTSSSCSGNAATATNVAYSGLTGTVPTWNQNTTGNAATATTASACSGNAATSSSCSGNAATASSASATATGNSFQMASLGVGTAASGTAGEIRATNNVTAYYSDDRLKDRGANIQDALDKVCRLSGFHYTANATAQALGYEPIPEIGVSAQEVQAIFPEVVAPAPIDDKYLTVRYERLVPLLIEAIKELRAELRALKG